MAYADHPDALYDAIIDDRTYPTVNGTTVPVREQVIERIATHAGETRIELERPSTGVHTLVGSEPIPERDQLLKQLAAAQNAFDRQPVSTLSNLHGDAGRLGPLHYTNQTAHFTVSENIEEAFPQHGTGPVPEQFQELGVKAAHLAEGFEIANSLPYHWVTGVGWEVTRFESIEAATEDEHPPENRAPPVEDCLVINIAIEFPAQRFGDATTAPSGFVNQVVARTEQALVETLLTKRMAQLEAIEANCEILIDDVEQGALDVEISELRDLDAVIQETFDISESALASLRSQREERLEKAFETVRDLSESDDFNYVMSEFAETIDDLGRLAMLGSEYRREVLDESPGFY